MSESMNRCKLRDNRSFLAEIRNSRSHNGRSFSRPTIIGYMSVDGARQYRSDLSELKFLNSNVNTTTYLDLNHNMSAAVKRSTDDNEEKIDLLLRFLIDKHQYLFPQFRADFFTYRRTLICVMCTAFDAKPILIKACLYRGSIYLCYMKSAEETSRDKSCSDEEKKFCAWGYKFEQYMSSDQPNQEPNIQRPVIENAEFSLYYHARLGDHTLLYGAQIDSLLVEKSTSPTPKTEDFETNVNYLKSNSYAELKTNRELQHFKQEKNFKRYKLFRCWCQCYLANLKGMYVGFRNDQGIVERLQWFDTQDIVNYCKHEWHPQVALDYLNQFLAFVKHSFEEYKNQPGPITLDFQSNIDKSFSVTDNCDNNVLPTWYTQQCQW